MVVEFFGQRFAFEPDLGEIPGGDGAGLEQGGVQVFALRVGPGGAAGFGAGDGFGGEQELLETFGSAEGVHRFQAGQYLRGRELDAIFKEPLVFVGQQRQGRIFPGHAQAFAQCFDLPGRQRRQPGGKADYRVVAVFAGLAQRREALFAGRGIEFGQDVGERAALPQRVLKAFGVGFRQGFLQFLPDSFRHQAAGFAGIHHAGHQPVSFRRNAEAQVFEAGQETGGAQNAHRVFDEGVRYVPEHAVLQVARTVVRVDQPAVAVLGHGVDGQVAPRQVFFQRGGGREVHAETFVAGGGFAFGARQRILFLGFRVQEYREAAADLLIAERQHFFGRGADHHPVAFLDRQSQQFVANRAADQVSFHVCL